VKEKIRELIERLANGTSSLGGPYTVAKVMRVEDSKLWLRYMETKHQLTLEAQKTRFPPPNEAQTFLWEHVAGRSRLYIHEDFLKPM